MSHSSPDKDARSLPHHDNALPEIEITLIRSDDPLTKTYHVTEDGVPEVAKHPFLVTGKALRARFAPETFASEFPDFLASLDTNECIVLGAMPDEVLGDIADITTKERHHPRDPGDGSPLIWRGKDWLGHRSGRAAVLGMDFDTKGMPSRLRERVEAAGGVLAVLHSSCPGLRDATCVSRPSSSAGIVAVDSGATTQAGGSHSYVLIQDGGDAADFIDRLHNRLMLEGWGYAYVSEAGSILLRSLVDTSASGSGERLWFESDAILAEGLEHVAGSRNPVAVHGAMLDTRQALAPLTTDEINRLTEIHAELRASVADEAASKRQRHAERVREQIMQRGEDDASTGDLVERMLDADTRGVLTGRHLLNLDDGRVVSVGNILADRDAFHRTTCADPLEPSYGGGMNKAIIYTDGRHPRLFSHAHGGRLFTLALDEVDVAATVDAARVEGKDPAKLVRKMATDVIFSTGGWAKIEAETGWQIADAPDIGALTISTIPSSPMIVLPAATPSELAPLDSGKSPAVIEPLDPEPSVDLLMRDFNSRFAVVAEGGSTGVVRLAFNAELNRRTPVTMTLDAFRLLYGNRYVQMPRMVRGEIEYQDVPATTVWLRHEGRRTCPDGFCIDPTGKAPETCFNLWMGFGVEEREGDWSKLAGMIFDVLAAGDEDHFTYIIMWLAHLVQRPHESPGVALVFRGEEGTGKGTLGRALMRLMKPHALQITHSKHLTGAFNAHMRTVLLLFADEAFFAGDKANEGALKGLITEDYRVNEGKGRDATLGRNRIHLMMASNNAWVIPAGPTARRFAVFDVSSRYKQNRAYFAEINDEMDVDGDAAGIAAMLYDLRRIPLDINLVRTAPETAGLHAQRIASMRGTVKWLFDVLTRGYIGSYPSDTWRETYSTEELFDSYRSWATETKEGFPADRHALGKFLATMFQSCRPRSGNGERPPSYRFGTLTKARQVFAEKQGTGDAWSADDAT
jgi:hypothetical protein